MIKTIAFGLFIAACSNNQNYDDEIYWSEMEEQWADFEILDKDLDDLTW